MLSLSLLVTPLSYQPLMADTDTINNIGKVKIMITLLLNLSWSVCKVSFGKTLAKVPARCGINHSLSVTVQKHTNFEFNESHSAATIFVFPEIKQH